MGGNEADIEMVFRMRASAKAGSCVRRRKTDFETAGGGLHARKGKEKTRDYMDPNDSQLLLSRCRTPAGALLVV